MTVSEIFETMDYGPAPESADEALGWLADQDGSFGHFIGGAFTTARADFESRNPATGEALAMLSQGTRADIDTAVAAARKAQGKWAKLGGHGRAKVLYALARGLQKHSRLFAVLETLDTGKPIREARDIDIPLAQRHFYYHAGMAQLMEEELPGRAPLGVCGQVIPWNFPLLMLAWKVAPALAMGNTVVLKPAEYTSLTALRFAQLCQQAGVPEGVVNIVTGDGETGAALVAHEGIDKVAFTGSTDVGRDIRRSTAGSGKALTLELGGKSPYLVFEDADIDSAIEGLVDAIWFNQGQVCCAGSRLIVQEGIAESFYARLRTRMDQLRIGNPLDKCIDVGAIVDPAQLERIRAMVGANSAGDTYVARCDLPEGCFYPPTLITGLTPADALMQEEIFGPVLCATTFRTPDEAVQIANNTRYGLAASVWSENLNTALDIAPRLRAGVVWVNGTNMFDAAAEFGGVRDSGFGREGGWDGLMAYTRAAGKPGKRPEPVPPMPAGDAPGDGIDRTAKMYVGGKQARPDSGYSQGIWSRKGALLGEVGLGSRKDVRNAVEAAQKASGWARTTGHLRAQILYYIAENLSARAGELTSRLDAMTGGKGGKGEVAASVDALFRYAAWADKFAGDARSVPIRGLALALREPTGVIGILCGDEAPLLGAITPMAAALAMGNTCVLLASEAFPLAATDLYQVLDTSDVPGGAVNILTGRHADMAGTLADHMDVDAVWSFGAASLDTRLEEGAADNLKRVWCPAATLQDIASRSFLEAATEVKTIWVPYGA